MPKLPRHRCPGLTRSETQLVPALRPTAISRRLRRDRDEARAAPPDFREPLLTRLKIVRSRRWRWNRGMRRLSKTGAMPARRFSPAPPNDPAERWRFPLICPLVRRFLTLA